MNNLNQQLKSFTGILFAVFSFLSATGQNKLIPVDTTYTVDRVFRQNQKKFPHAYPAKDSLPKGVDAFRDIVYTTLRNTPYGDRPLHLDVFRPASTEKRPALIMVHGGGWRSGTRSMQVPMAQMLAAKGWVTIPVEYQLSLEAQYPAAVHNIKSAIRWAMLNGEKYGIDTSKIAISGCSAGGQLAALVGLTNGVDIFEGDQGNRGVKASVKAIIDVDGVIDFLAPSSLNLPRNPQSADVAWLGGTFEEKPAIWKQASSIFWANPHTAVPMLFINSGFPRFHAGQDELIGMMKEWGIYTEVQKFDVQLHPFWLLHPWVDDTVEHMHRFLTRCFQ